ncbi:type II toxin-antitoxin system RelE family toxin [Streptomyces johnsoniae]|uniref:Type II toxin-antitoxin system RelE/ParE family toxin n=1 Tax=Streptomyces johnsoniae TaxID=3075532 RepID=A0ABU2S035_9ACTN|nr:type II toxin-antitoxin system RelE/ParE family toxin [Streptomyces sp. DSM 41886]MDT0441425.1 type II toxin-antitoxin system RelE/ParE family toxin [Streptomyces sp. DSM 41886]
MQYTPEAERSLTRLRKADPEGVDQVLDSINLLLRNPRPSGAHSYGGDQFRMRICFYRVLYTIVSSKPLVISVDHVGRGRTP